MKPMKQLTLLALSFALTACAGTASQVQKAPNETDIGRTESGTDANPLPPPEPTAEELLAQADESMSAHRTQEAAELLKRVIDKEPSRADARLRLARLLAEQSNPEEAFRHLTEILAGAPDHREALEQMAALLTELPDRRPQAIQFVLRALETSPDDARWLALLAELHWKTGDAASARADLNRLLTAHPEDGRACTLLAFISLEQGHFREADFHSRRAVSRLPEDASAHHARGLALAALRPDGSDTEAVQHLKQSVALDASSPAAWFDLGRVLLRNRSCSEAEKAFRQARALISDNKNAGMVCLALAAAVEAQKDAAGKTRFTEAEALYRQAMAAMPKSPDPLTALADLKAGPMKDLREAETLYSAALSLLPEGVQQQELEKKLTAVRQRLAAEAELSAASGAEAE